MAKTIRRNFSKKDRDRFAVNLFFKMERLDFTFRGSCLLSWKNYRFRYHYIFFWKNSL